MVQVIKYSNNLLEIQHNYIHKSLIYTNKLNKNQI